MKKRILGIDSDTFQIGWFSACEDRADWRYGTLWLGGSQLSFDERLVQAIVKMRGLLLREGPDVVAIEMPYLGLNVQTTIKLAQIVGTIRALAWFGAAEVMPFQPSEGKMALSGNGQETDAGMMKAMYMVLLGEFSAQEVDKAGIDPHMAHALGGFEFARAELWRRSL